MRSGIDTVEAYFHENVNLEKVKRRAAALLLSYALERVGSSGSWALRIGSASSEHVYLHLGKKDASHAIKLISNFSNFSSFKRYCNFVTQIFGRNEYESLRLYRLDVFVDPEVDFQQFKKWIRVPYKQLNRADTNKGRHRTGITFGRRPSIVCLYDKTEEQRKKGIELEHAVTRIEVRLFGEQLPVEHLRELPQVLGLNRKGNRFRPFRAISVEPMCLEPLENFSAPPLQTAKAVAKLIIRIRLDTYLEVGGYDLAYRQLNTQGNFRRDIRQIATFEEYPHDFDQILTRSLEQFFGRQSRRRRYDF